MKKQLLFILSFALFFCSCSQDALEESMPGDAIVNLSFSSDNTTLEFEQTSKAAEPTLVADDFKVRLENTVPQVLREWATWSAVPQPLRVVPGSYQLIASSGAPLVAPRFDTPYYEGAVKFTVANKQKLDLALKAQLAAAKVQVSFGSGFDEAYSAYSVDIRTAEDMTQFLNYTKTDATAARAGYFGQGTLRMRFHLTTKDGVLKTFSPAPIPNVKFREFHRLNFDVKSNTGSLVLTVTTDTGVTEYPLNIMIPDGWLPRAAPKVNLTGFVSAATISTVEGFAKNAAVTFVAANGVKKVMVTHTSPTLTTLGVPASFDILTLDPARRKILNDNGMRWSDELNDATVAIKTFDKMLTISFTDLIRNLDAGVAVAADHGIDVTITDGADITNNDCRFTVKVGMPNFTLAAFKAGNVWATAVDFMATYSSERANPVVIQYKQGGAWVDCPTQKSIASAGNTIFRASALTPATAYDFRVKLHGNRFYSELKATTGTVEQVPGADFETWYVWKDKTGNKITQHYLYSEANRANGNAAKWWSTRNPASAGQTNGLQYGYTANNGTEPVDINGSKAARLRTTGWGKGSTNAAGTSILYNTSAGVLFIGDYECVPETSTTNEVLKSEEMIQGRPFTSRPNAFTFSYAYSPCSGGDSFVAYAELVSGSTVIARAEATDITSASQQNMTNVKLPFVYSNLDLMPTGLRVFFSSSVKLGVNTKYLNSNGLPPIVRSGNPNVGSVLTLDNVVMDYNF
ncbi:MAG: DUF4493 domain-containing protein [Mucinivorans sp.]